jgi:hypothetical protein
LLLQNTRKSAKEKDKERIGGNPAEKSRESSTEKPSGSWARIRHRDRVRSVREAPGAIILAQLPGKTQALSPAHSPSMSGILLA